MPSKSQFWCIFNWFLEGKWRHVGTKIKEKLIQIAKSDFLINRALAAAGAWFLRFQGSKLGAKTHQKTIKKRSQHGKASWHRFLMDFDGFGEANWQGKSSQEASKMVSKKRWKNEGQQDGEQIEKRSPDDPRSEGSRARVFPQLGKGKTPPQHGRVHPPPKTFKILTFFDLDFYFIFLPNMAAQIHQNRTKIDVKMPSHVDFLFWSIFNRFLIPTSTPEIWNIEPPLQRELDIWKIAFPSLHRFLIQFWWQFASILAPKIDWNVIKDRSQEAPKNHQFFNRFFITFQSM